LFFKKSQEQLDLEDIEARKLAALEERENKVKSTTQISKVNVPTRSIDIANRKQMIPIEEAQEKRKRTALILLLGVISAISIIGVPIIEYQERQKEIMEFDVKTINEQDLEAFHKSKLGIESDRIIYKPYEEVADLLEDTYLLENGALFFKNSDGSEQLIGGYDGIYNRFAYAYEPEGTLFKQALASKDSNYTAILEKAFEEKMAKFIKKYPSFVEYDKTNIDNEDGSGYELYYTYEPLHYRLDITAEKRIISIDITPGFIEMQAESETYEPILIEERDETINRVFEKYLSGGKQYE
jgi:hypothetical protein